MSVTPTSIHRLQISEPYWMPEVRLGIGRYQAEVGGLPHGFIHTIVLRTKLRQVTLPPLKSGRLLRDFGSMGCFQLETLRCRCLTHRLS